VRARIQRNRAHVVVALNELRRGGVRVVLAVGAVAVGIAATTSMLALEASMRSAIADVSLGNGRVC